MFRKNLRHFAREQRAEMDEAVFVYPLLLVLAFGLVNLSLLGFASMNAANAANLGARMGSVSQGNAAGVAHQHASAMLTSVPVGSYTVSVQGSGTPGQLIQVQVGYAVPNYFAGPASFFGVTMPATFEGATISLFRQEGW